MHTKSKISDCLIEVYIQVCEVDAVWVNAIPGKAFWCKAQHIGILME